jgi:uncharacterized protein
VAAGDGGRRRKVKFISVLTLDTSGILAALNKHDPHHAQALAALHADPGPFILPTGIMAEVTYMIESRFGPDILDAFLADLVDGAFALDCGEDDLPHIRTLVSRYRDLPLGYADAAVISCAVRNGYRVLTYDLRHFSVVAGGESIRLVGFEHP